MAKATKPDSKPTPPSAPQAPKAESKAAVYTVVERFRDKNNRKRVYGIGEDVSHLPAERLAELVEKGLVTKD